ncbi:hypothetical protein [Marinoscillum furvescens]|uniref:Uncharacterized protein n=1 Tax=Marinoscillum furvescens DSM 4134 TaxID=1122208 RepID=A0A3D9L8D8_MARFU|nr:hypothetical protein [Marinoscillum furvescens]REE01745.1 hypothetical protein C7460_103262 [Marinoscillum furvescens DSM 4134]
MFRLLCISLISMLLFTSCLEYEEEISEVSYGRKGYIFSDVLLEDWGNHAESHYNVDMTFIGESSMFERHVTDRGNTIFTLTEQYDVYIFLELFAAGQKGLKPGVYTMLGEDELEDVPEQDVFRRFFFGRSSQEGIPAESGEIRLIITHDGTYRLTFDVELASGRELSGTFAGIPHYLDQRQNQ